MNSEEISARASSDKELLTSTGASKLKPGSIFVVSCSTAITGSISAITQTWKRLWPCLTASALLPQGHLSAAQCCEHPTGLSFRVGGRAGLRRARVRQAPARGRQRFRHAYERMASPCREFVSARRHGHSGTLIGVHLKQWRSLSCGYAGSAGRSDVRLHGPKLIGGGGRLQVKNGI